MEFLYAGSIPSKSNTSHENAALLHVRLYLDLSEGIDQNEFDFWRIMAQDKISVEPGLSDLERAEFLPPDIFSKEMQAASLLLALERPLMSGISTHNARIIRIAQNIETLGHAAILKILRGMGPIFIEDTTNQADFLKLVRGIVTTCSTSNLRLAGLVLLGRYLDTVHDFDASNPNFKAVLTRMLDSTISVRSECIRIIKKIMFTKRDAGVAAHHEIKSFAVVRKNILVAVGESLSQKISEDEKAQHMTLFSEAWFADSKSDGEFSIQEKLDEMVAVLRMLKNFPLDVTKIFKTAAPSTFQSYTMLLLGRVQGLASSLAGMSTQYEIILAFARSNPNEFEVHIPTLKSMFLTLEQLSLQGHKESSEYLWLVVDILGEVLSIVENRPADLEEVIFLSCFSGSLKFTDRRRCSHMEEIQKAIRLFCCLRDEKAENLFKVILSNSMAFLKTCIENPSEQTSAWGM
jgi:hypothetical protein